MSFGDFFQQDPSTQGLIDPQAAQNARNMALINLGLGIMAAPYSGRGTAAGLGAAFQNTNASYQDAMDNAFRHTIAARQVQHMQEDRDFQQKERELQLAQQERAAQESSAQTAQRVLSGMDSFTKNGGSPEQYLSLVQGSPEFQTALKTLGVQSPYTGPMAAPGQMDDFLKQLRAAASVSAPAAAPIKLGPGEQLLNPSTYQPLASVAAKPIEVNLGDKTALVDPNSHAVVATYQHGLTPDQQQGTMSPAVAQLDAALSSAGVQLQGTRSPKMYNQRLQALISANPGMAPADIADKVRTGQIDYNGAKRSTQQLSTTLAAARAQAGKLEQDFAAMEPLVAKADVSGSPIINKAWAQWEAGSSGDKDTAKLITYFNETATEYAKLNSGSTGSAAPAEGEINAARAVMRNAFSAGGFQGIKEALMESAQHKISAYGEGLRAAATPGASVGNPQPTATTAASSSFATPEAAALAAQQGKIKKGDRITVNGVSGTWQ